MVCLNTKDVNNNNNNNNNDSNADNDMLSVFWPFFIYNFYSYAAVVSKMLFFWP